MFADSRNLNTETNQNTKCSAVGGDITVSDSCNQRTANNVNNGVQRIGECQEIQQVPY